MNILIPSELVPKNSKYRRPLFEVTAVYIVEGDSEGKDQVALEIED